MQTIRNLSLLLAQTARPESGETDAMISNPFVEVTGIIVCTVGVCLLIFWLSWFEGFGALKKAPTRRCHWLFSLCAIGILVLWLMVMIGIVGGIDLLMKNHPKLTQEAALYAAQAFGVVGLIGLILYIARKLIPRGMKGWGLNPATLVSDTTMAAVNLTAVYPLLMLGLWLVMSVGTLINPEFSIEVHESLDLLTEAGIGLRIMVVVFAAVIVPVFEELLFRGMFQTCIRCFSGSSWAAIVFTSLFFAILHPPTHFLALFMFSCGLGYAYERSGSLFRPILMHMLFNLINITATLLTS